VSLWEGGAQRGQVARGAQAREVLTWLFPWVRGLRVSGAQGSILGAPLDVGLCCVLCLEAIRPCCASHSQPTQGGPPWLTNPPPAPAPRGWALPLSLFPAEQREMQIPSPHTEASRGRAFSCRPKILVAWEKCGWGKL